MSEVPSCPQQDVTLAVCCRNAGAAKHRCLKPVSPPSKAHACLHLKRCFSYDALKCVVKVYNLLKSFPLMSYFKIFLNISVFPMLLLKRFWVLPAGAALAGWLRWAPLLCSALPVAPCIALEMTLRLIDSTARPCFFFFFSLLTAVE